jgi:hypothetical protein
MSMTPRLMVVCLGGLAGAGALVCCDLDEGIETVETAPDGQAVESGVAVDEPQAAEAEAPALH